MSQMPIGRQAPDFSLKAALPDGREQEVSLAGYSGKWLVLYFYPKDNTAGCTVEAQEFSSLAPEFAALGAVVLGVSRDSLKSHQGFIAKKQLAVTLLSDPQTEVLGAYGAWGEKKNYGKTSLGTIRSTVLIDPQGKVAAHWPQAKSKGHAAQVLEALVKLIG